jgi:hypothetical protein
MQAWEDKRERKNAREIKIVGTGKYLPKNIYENYHS